MVAPVVQLDDTPALVAPAPAMVRGESERLIQSFIGRTVAAVACGLLAQGAGSLVACRAGSDFVHDPSSSDEGRTACIKAVGSVAGWCVEFFLLLLEERSKAFVDSGFDVIPGHLDLAASWRVQGFVRHGCFVEVFKAWDAVLVAARRFPDLLG